MKHDVSPDTGLSRPKEGQVMEKQVETREQTMKKIEFRLPQLTDAQLRMVSAFIRGFWT